MNVRAKRAEPLSAEQLAEYEEFGFGEKFARLLYIRGIDTRQKVKDFFDFSPQRLHNPFLLRGMPEAVTRINAAIQNRQRILIIGDYDCDGICATAILYKYFISNRVNTRYFLPNRDVDGYGLNCDLIQKLHTRFQPNLIITVDCGISCHVEIEYAKSLGIDCIVTDHHSIPETCPKCICVDPKFPGQEYPFAELCGAGVALKLVQALATSRAGDPNTGIETALKYVDIACLATVADIVSLHDENRVIVKLGLERLNKGSLPAISVLAKSCNIMGEIRASDISYKLGPKINAAGRMGNAKRGLDLLLEKNEAEIEKIIASLGELNSARKDLCQKIYRECDLMIEENNLADKDIIILKNDNWESGVLGIVAARITEKFLKPSIVFTKSGGVYKGSARSVGEINIVKTLEALSHHLATFGGHHMAAGLSVPVENFDIFTQDLINHVNTTYHRTDFESDRLYDFELDLGDVTPQFINECEKLEPTGCDNPPPSFLTTVHAVRTQTLSNYPQHLRIHIGPLKPGPKGPVSITFMFFNGANTAWILEHDVEKQLLFEFQKPEGGKAGTQLKAICKEFLPSQTFIAGLSVDRETFVEYYKLIKAQQGKQLIINSDQMKFCVTVFQQLGILSLKNNYVKINDKIKVDLEKSTAYQNIKEKIWR